MAKTTSNKHIDVQDSVQIGATTFEAKSRPARIALRLITVATLLFMLYGAYGPLSTWVHRRDIPPPSICVICPDPFRASEGAFYQDGVVQQRGFEKAVLDCDAVPNRLEVRYHHMKKDDAASDTLAAMKSAYASNGATFFIMTMSSKVADIRQHFARWRSECERDGKRLPIMIATVASAPDIADPKSGIVRWYVRSEEESALLAQYLRWHENVLRVGIFYITRTPGQSDDRYGEYGMKVFRDQFLHSLGGTRADAYSTTATTAKDQVAQYLAALRLDATSTNTAGAFIVGYGNMVQEVLSQLLAQGFPGPIACTSTLTEPEWQPTDTSGDTRICTVVPRLADPQSSLTQADRNVVFYFSKQTLTRVISLTAADSKSEAFVERWTSDHDHVPIDQDYLANGDIIVHLSVATSKVWR